MLDCYDLNRELKTELCGGLGGGYPAIDIIK